QPVKIAFRQVPEGGLQEAWVTRRMAAHGARQLSDLHVGQPGPCELLLLCQKSPHAELSRPIGEPSAALVFGRRPVFCEGVKELFVVAQKKMIGRDGESVRR